MKKILLDTHFWIWLVSGSKELKQKQINLINEAAQNNELYIAAISIWEVAMLVNKGGIVVEQPLLSFIKKVLILPYIAIQPLTPEIAVKSSTLPDNFHGDSADRLIIATACIHNCTLLTRDKKILIYAKKKYLSALAV